MSILEDWSLGLLSVGAQGVAEGGDGLRALLASRGVDNPDPTHSKGALALNSGILRRSPTLHTRVLSPSSCMKILCDSRA